jgi:hypothetical protein
MIDTEGSLQGPECTAYPASTNVVRGGFPLVTAYAAKRPMARGLSCREWDSKAHDVHVLLTERPGRDRFFGRRHESHVRPRAVCVALTGANSRPDPNGSARGVDVARRRQRHVPILRSITVLRGLSSTNVVPTIMNGRPTIKVGTTKRPADDKGRHYISN